jgi:hypothetical protein
VLRGSERFPGILVKHMTWDDYHDSDKGLSFFRVDAMEEHDSQRLLNVDVVIPNKLANRVFEELDAMRNPTYTLLPLPDASIPKSCVYYETPRPITRKGYEIGCAASGNKCAALRLR